MTFFLIRLLEDCWIAMNYDFSLIIDVLLLCSYRISGGHMKEKERSTKSFKVEIQRRCL